MSHNVTLKGISISDFNLLKAALTEINSQFGTKFELIEGQHAGRNYGGARAIAGTVGLIRDPSMDYDITLTKDADGKVSMQTESMLINRLIDKFGIDPKHAMDVSTGNACNVTNVGYGRNEAMGMQLALGTIIQRYSVLNAERTAAMTGKSTRREVDSKTGVMNVVATTY